MLVVDVRRMDRQNFRGTGPDAMCVKKALLETPKEATTITRCSVRVLENSCECRCDQVANSLSHTGYCRHGPVLVTELELQ